MHDIIDVEPNARFEPHDDRLGAPINVSSRGKGGGATAGTQDYIGKLYPYAYTVEPRWLEHRWLVYHG